MQRSPTERQGQAIAVMELDEDSSDGQAKSQVLAGTGSGAPSSLPPDSFERKFGEIVVERIAGEARPGASEGRRSRTGLGRKAATRQQSSDGHLSMGLPSSGGSSGARSRRSFSNSRSRSLKRRSQQQKGDLEYGTFNGMPRAPSKSLVSSRRGRDDGRAREAYDDALSIQQHGTVSISDSRDEEEPADSRSHLTAFEILEEEHRAQRKREKEEELMKKLPRKAAMDALNLEFDAYDRTSRCQMFIDKESHAVLSERSSESCDSALLGSVQSHQQPSAATQKIMEVLDLPPNKRTTELVERIMPLFKEFEGFKKIKQMNAELGQEIPKGFWAKVLQSCWIERYQKGDYIIRQGERGDKFYIIVDGAVQYLGHNEHKAKALAELNREEKREAVPTHRASARGKGATDTLGASSAKQASLLSQGSARQHHPHQQPAAGHPAIRAAKPLATPPPVGSAPASGRGSREEPHRAHASGRPGAPGERAREAPVNYVVLTELGRAHGGGMFGEIAIRDPSHVRQASVRATKPCVLLTLTGRDYQRYLKSILEKIDDERIEFLQGTSLFKTWSKAHCRAFMGYVKTHTLHKGHAILRQGHARPTLILVKKGSVRLSIKVKKPYSSKTQEGDVLKAEKFKLKDTIHGIERNT